MKKLESFCSKENTAWLVWKWVDWVGEVQTRDARPPKYNWRSLLVSHKSMKGTLKSFPRHKIEWFCQNIHKTRPPSCDKTNSTFSSYWCQYVKKLKWSAYLSTHSGLSYLVQCNVITKTSKIIRESLFKWAQVSDKTVLVIKVAKRFCQQIDLTFATNQPRWVDMTLPKARFRAKVMAAQRQSRQSASK